MMIINYMRDREKIRLAGDELSGNDLMTHITCADDTKMDYDQGVLTMKGKDIDLRIEHVNHFSSTIVNYG